MRKERIVITGMGAISCNGIKTDDFIKNVNENISGIKACTRYDMSKLRSQLVGEIDYEQLYKILPNTDEIEKTIYLAYYAAHQAIIDAGIDFASMDKNVVIVIGSLFGGYNTSVYVHENFLKDHQLKDIDTTILDYFTACSIPNYLSKKFNIKGAKLVVSNACASGGSAVGIAYDLIQSGLVDMAIAGGTDELNRLSLAGFNSLSALSTQNCTPYTNSTGINIGEGAGIFVLEKLFEAQKRNCNPKAEIIGYELNSDAFHVTAPDPNGEGAFRAMKSVLERNEISIEDVSYINGHGTGTNANDTSEMKSVKRLFADSSKLGKLTSNKGVIGHCMGAAGALELFISAKSIKDCKIPPTFHTEKQKELRGIQIIKEAETGPCSLVLSNSFAFGGNNVSIGISAPEYFNKSQLDGELSDDDVVITGIGCIGNKHTSFNEYVSLLDNNDTEFAENESYKGKYSSIYSGVIPEYDYRNYMSPDFFRKTDFISKLSIISSASAIKDANLKITRANTERIGLVYGTGTGPISTIEQLNLDIIQKGLVGMNAFLFPNSVNNAAPGYITMNSRIKGTTITLNSGAATFNLSILYARLILLQNKADNVIVTVSDDYNEVYHAAYDKLGLLNKKSKVDSFFESQNTRLLSPGSVSIILERKETAIEREAKIYARVLGGTFSGFCSVSSASSANDELDFVGQEMYNTYDATLKSVGLSEKDLDIYFSSSTGKISMDIIERDNIINKCKIPIISSARQFCGYNISLIPAYSTLSAIAAFSGHPAYNIVSGQTHKQNNIKKAMIASYAIGETFGNIIIDKFN